jgi:hypothetical protein
VGAPPDPASIQVRLDDARRGDEVRVPGHRAGHPIDIRRLESRDLPEGVTVELAELDDVLERTV